MDHLGGWQQAAFRSDEEDAAPVAIDHAGEIVAGEARAAHHIHLEDMMPVGVADVGEVLRFVDAQIVDEDVGVGDGGDQGGGALRRGGIGEDGIDRAADLRGGGVQLGLAAAGDGDGNALLGQAPGDGETDAGGRSGDDGALAHELQIHGKFPFKQTANWTEDSICFIHD